MDSSNGDDSIQFRASIGEDWVEPGVRLEKKEENMRGIKIIITDPSLLCAIA